MEFDIPNRYLEKYVIFMHILLGCFLPKANSQLAAPAKSKHSWILD